tara:strand:+ start:691 stop:1584 length:894 start_codon:yes stop_codon:yes gene_type:complete
MHPFDPERMEKLPGPCRFFDINGLWYFANGWAVRWLYDKPVSANQITVISLVFGFISAGFYISSHSNPLIFGAIFLYGKLFFDNVDGPLARVRGETSRLGRFLDSFVDFVINVAVYVALSYYLVRHTGQAYWWAVGLVALLSCLIHCSLFVFYLVQYTTRVGSYDKNRVREALTETDYAAWKKGKLPAFVFFLQNIHQWIYDWQDNLIERLDGIFKRLAGTEKDDNWYLDKVFLALASPLCLCTNTMALIVFSLIDRLDVCFFLVVVGGNVYMLGITIWKIFHFRRLIHQEKTLPPY